MSKAISARRQPVYGRWRFVGVRPGKKVPELGINRYVVLQTPPPGGVEWAHSGHHKMPEAMPL